MSGNRSVKTGLLVFAAVVLGVLGRPAGGESPDREIGEYVPPALTPAPYLIRDPAVRGELKLTGEQTARVQELCDGMDEHLFALRDEAPTPTDPAALEHVRAVVKGMETLATVLTPPQQGRLQELALQFEGAMALFRSAPAACIQLAPDQHQRMQMLYRQSQRLREELRRRLRESGEEAQFAQQAEQIQVRFMQQFLMTLTEPQRVVWEEMLGEPFDFSRTRPVSFRAPELREVSGWLNTRPLTLKGLGGRVAAVIFWTFNAPGSAADYPVYKMWARQFDAKEVLVLGIHTPQSEGEMDPAALRKVVEQEGLRFPISTDDKNANRQAWVNRIVPSVYLVDKAGRVRYWWYGPLRGQGAAGDQWMTERIEELRAERPDSSSGRPQK